MFSEVPYTKGFVSNLWHYQEVVQSYRSWGLASERYQVCAPLCFSLCVLIAKEVLPGTARNDVWIL